MEEQILALVKLQKMWAIREKMKLAQELESEERVFWNENLEYTQEYYKTNYEDWMEYGFNSFEQDAPQH